MAAPSTPVAPTAPPSATVISIRELKVHCGGCSMRELCLPAGIGQDGLKQLDQVVTERVRIRKGASLYSLGGRFNALYAIRRGSCKTTMLAEDGREQIVGYHMLGDIIGLDGIATDRYGCGAVALEDTEVCVLPFDQLEELARAVPSLQHNLHRLLSHEIGREQNVMLVLGSMRSEQRLAVFLLNLSDRYRRRGYSSSEFVLRMTRGEIGSYLGLKLETVSRLFSRLQQQGLLQVQGRALKLLDVPALRKLAGQHR